MRTLLLLNIVITSTAAISPMSGWIKYLKNGNCYMFVCDNVNFTVARSECEKLGAALTTICNKEENDFIATLARGCFIKGWCNSAITWIGMEREDKSGKSGVAMQWLSKKDCTFSYWHKGEPNNGRGGIEHCGHLWTNTDSHWDEWNDTRCWVAGISQELEHAIESYDCKCLEDPSEDYDLLVSGLLRKNTISKACRLAVKESIQAYRRLKLLEAAQKGSSIKRCKRDLCDQKAVMSALMDKDGNMRTLLLLNIVISSTAAIDVMSGWIKNLKNGNCYMFVCDKVNFTVARSQCEKLGAGLTTICDEDENDFIANAGIVDSLTMHTMEKKSFAYTFRATMTRSIINGTTMHARRAENTYAKGNATFL
ncbi:hypothetical protein Q1695_008343 [Nippostrongylus brasiliensis]|nr:hypothetical protein Q1695_008343 [Nippostrongylus brasiliensis]